MQRLLKGFHQVDYLLMTCHIYYINEIKQKKEFIIQVSSMQQLDSIIQAQSLHSKKEIMQMKRLKAKQKTNISSIKPQTKQDLRKQRNRSAAQKSRDRKKEYLQHLQSQNSRLKNIISRCQICSALEFNNRPQQRVHEQHEDQQPILINQTPPTFVNETFIRQQSKSEEGSSNLSQYFWFGCVLVLVIMANYQSHSSNNTNRQLVGDIRMYVPELQFNLTNSKKTQGESPLQGSKALVQNKNYCQLCIQCLKNISSKNNRSISLFGNQTIQIKNISTPNKILYCKSRARFFLKIYQALNEKQQQNKSREITRVLIKGNILKDMMEEDCFSGEQINSEEQYLISFSVAIFEMTQVKASRKSRLSTHNDS